MKKILSVILFSDINKVGLDRTLRDVRYLNNVLKKSEKIYILDLRKYYLGKINLKLPKINNKNIICFEPRNIKDLSIFLKNKITYAYGPISPNFRTILIFLIIKYFKINLIFMNIYGYYLNENSKKDFRLKDRIHYFYNNRFSYYVCRILTIMNILPRVEFYFESSQERINFINKSLSKKLEKIIPFFKFSYFKKIIRINSIYYDDMLLEKKKNVKKNIVVIDTGIGHKDNIQKEPDNYMITNDYIINYYLKTLKTIQKFSQKEKCKIYFCKHPKTYYPKGCFKNTKNIKFNYDADNYIWTAKHVFFTGGSSMFNKAIILKKNITVLISQETLRFQMRLINSIDKIFKLNIYNLDNKTKKNNKILINQYNKKKYEKFISQNLIFKKKIHSSKIIRNQIFN